jgi:hypothetical protein
MKINVKTLNAGTFPLTIQKDDTILSVKTRIADTIEIATGKRTYPGDIRLYTATRQKINDYVNDIYPEKDDRAFYDLAYDLSIFNGATIYALRSPHLQFKAKTKKSKAKTKKSKAKKSKAKKSMRKAKKSVRK